MLSNKTKKQDKHLTITRIKTTHRDEALQSAIPPVGKQSVIKEKIRLTFNYHKNKDHTQGCGSVVRCASKSGREHGRKAT